MKIIVIKIPGLFGAVLRKMLGMKRQSAKSM